MRNAHLGDNLCSRSRVLQTRDPGLESTILDPQWHCRVQTSGACGVRVHVRGNAYTRRPRGINHADYLVELAPVVLARHFEVIDFSGRATRLGDVDGFLHRCFDSITLAAHMRGVNPTSAS